MQPDQASDIVRQLTDGLDPTTGQAFPDDSPYQRPLIIRALYAALQALNDVQGLPGNRRRSPEHAGSPWSEQEDRRLGEAFDSARPVKDLATDHKRSTTAIKARLVKLGKLSETDSRFRV